MDFLSAIPWELMIIQTVNGLVTGMILALIASGLTLIFGIMDVVNFAHGELFMLGAYMGVVVLATSGSFWLALTSSILIIALLGGFSGIGGGPFYGTGYYGGGGLGLIIVILLILLLLGKL